MANEISKVNGANNLPKNSSTIMAVGATFTHISSTLQRNTGTLNIDDILGQTVYGTGGGGGGISDADLTAIAALTGTNTIYYRSAADTWSPVTVGNGVIFSGGLLRSPRAVGIGVYAPGIPIATGDGQAYYNIPSSMSGMTISSVHGFITNTGNGIVTVQLARVRSGSVADLLSTRLTIDANETGSNTAATPAVIATGDLITNDLLRIDVDGTGAGTTVARGLTITFEAI